MSKKNATTKVSPIPFEPFKYLVESWSEPDMPRTVDLLSYGGNGECQCPGFVIEKMTTIKKSGVAFDETTRCRHIEAAVMYQMNEILKDQSARQMADLQNQ
jgi:hypothetical protein